jgi:hypothetical protein
MGALDGGLPAAVADSAQPGTHPSSRTCSAAPRRSRTLQAVLRADYLHQPAAIEDAMGIHALALLALLKRGLRRLSVRPWRRTHDRASDRLG